MAGGTSAAMELKVLISIMQSGTALQTMLTQVGQLSQALTKLQQQQAQAGGGGVVPPVPPMAPQLNEGSDAAKKAALSMEGLERSINKVISAARFLAGGFLALQSVRFLKGLADVAAQNEMLGTVMHVVATNANIMAEDIDKVDKKIQSLGITIAASRQALTQFMQARLKLEFAPQLARAAQDLAVISGMDSSNTFKRLIVNIQQLDTLGLRLMGIVVDRTAAERKYKEEIGATNRELNKREQQTALMIGVLDKAKGMEGAYSSAMNDVAKQMTSLDRITTAYRGSLGEQLLPAYSAVVAEVTSMFEKLSILAAEFATNEERAQGLADAARSLAEVFSTVAVFLMENLETVITLVKWWLEFKVVMYALKGIEASLLWILKAVDWINKLRLAFIALRTTTVGFTVAMQAMGAASVTEAGKMMQLDIANKAIASSSAPAAAGLQATGLAARGAGLAASGLMIAWGSLAALMAIPIIGLIIYKLKAQVETEREKGAIGRAVEAKEGFVGDQPLTPELVKGIRPLRKQFEEWKREHPEIVSMLKTETALVAEFIKQVDFKAGTGVVTGFAKELTEAKEALQAAITERSQLLHPPEGTKPASPAERFAADQKFEAAGKKVKEVEDRMNKAFEAIPGTASTDAINKLIDRAKVLTAELGKIRKTKGVTTEEILAAEARLAVVVAEKKAALEKLPAALEREVPMDPKRRADLLAITQMKGDITAAADSALALQDATQQIFGGKYDFTPEGVSTKAFGTAFGGYRTLIDEANKMITEKGELPLDFLKRLDRGLESLGETAKLPLDLTRLKSLVPELEKLEAKAPGVTAKVRKAIAVGEEGVRKEALTFEAPLEARSKERARLTSDATQEELKQRMTEVKHEGAMLSEAQQYLYGQQLIGLQEYFDTRQEIVAKEADAELALQEAVIQGLEAQQSRTRDAREKEAIGIQIAGALAQKDAIQQRFTLETAKLVNQALEAKIKLETEVKTATIGLAAQYGGQEEALAQLNFQLNEEAKKYRASNIVGYENLLLKKQEAGILDILAKAQERSYQISLGQLNVQREQINLAEKQRGLRSAEIDAAAKTGRISEATAMGLRNEQILAAMEENRQRRAVEQQILDTSRNQRAAEYSLLAARLNSNTITDIEYQKQRQELYQKWNTILEGNVEAVVDLDTAFAGLSASIELYSVTVKEKFVDSFADALTQTITNVKNASQIWKSMATQIANEIIGIYMKAFSQKLFQRLSFGFLDRLIGGGIGGGGGGTVAPGNLGYAEGGPVRGPGTGTSDSIPAMVSAGEHIMPAAKAKSWMPLLEGIRLGKVTAYAAGGLVAVQSIAIPPVIPRRYAAGGVVMADAGAASVNTGPTTGNMVVSLHPDAMNMTLREWLEQEVVRQQGRR